MIEFIFVAILFLWALIFIYRKALKGFSSGSCGGNCKCSKRENKL